MEFIAAVRENRSMENIDDFDRRLLELLSIDCRQTGDQLSAQVGLSPAACLRRVQRLRRIGAIRREVAILSPEVTGRNVTVLVQLHLAHDRPDRIDSLKERFSRLAEVSRFFHVTGDADFVLIVSCASMEDYALFTEAWFYDPMIKGFESMVVLREYLKDLPPAQ